MSTRFALGTSRQALMMPIAEALSAKASVGEAIVNGMLRSNNLCFVACSIPLNNELVSYSVGQRLAKRTLFNFQSVTVPPSARATALIKARSWGIALAHESVICARLLAFVISSLSPHAMWKTFFFFCATSCGKMQQMLMLHASFPSILVIPRNNERIHSKRRFCSSAPW